MRRHIYVFFCVWLASILGCDGGVEGRREIAGTVSYGGKPVEDGRIVFEPEGPNLPMATGQVTNGEYQIEARFGPSPGPYRVRIEGYRKKKVPNMPPHPYLGDNQEPGVTAEQYLPLAYNARTTLQVEISDDGANVHNFELPAKGGR